MHTRFAATAHRSWVRVAVMAAQLASLAFGARAAVAQEPNAYGNLVFDAVPLGSAAGPPNITPPDAIATAALTAAVARHRAALDAALHGADLSGQIRELGLLAVAYQGLDRHDDALDVLDRAIDLARDADGRRTLEQIPLLEQQIPSLLARNDIRAVDDVEELIFELKERAYGAGGRQMYYATINLADWYTTAYYRENYGAGDRALRRQTGVVNRVQRCISVPGRVNADGSRACSENPIFSGEIKDVFDQDINDARLRKIDRLYKTYQEALIETGNVQLDIIIDLGRRVARLAFATKQEMDFERETNAYSANYAGSREQALRNSPARMNESYLTGERALRYAIEFPSSAAGLRPEAHAALSLDLGDWHLAYGKAAAAEQAYGDAYRILREAGFTAGNIDRGLAAESPVAIPVFATHPYSRRSAGIAADAPLVYRGHLDVAYAIDSLGNVSGIEFLGGSDGDDAEIRRRLDLRLQMAKFRPILDEGRLVAPGPVRARYYYAY